MAAYRIDLYSGVHLTGVHVVNAGDGIQATDFARAELAATNDDYAEVFMGDGAAGALYYTTVPVTAGVRICRVLGRPYTVMSPDERAEFMRAMAEADAAVARCYGDGDVPR